MTKRMLGGIGHPLAAGRLDEVLDAVLGDRPGAEVVDPRLPQVGPLLRWQPGEQLWRPARTVEADREVPEGAQQRVARRRAAPRRPGMSDVLGEEDRAAGRTLVAHEER